MTVVTRGAHSAHRLTRVEPDRPSTAAGTIPTAAVVDRSDRPSWSRFGRFVALLVAVDGGSTSAPMFLLGPTGGPLWTIRGGSGSGVGPSSTVPRAAIDCYCDRRSG